MKKDATSSGDVGSAMAGSKSNSTLTTTKQALVHIEGRVKVVQEDKLTSKNVHSTMKERLIKDQNTESKCSIFIESNLNNAKTFVGTGTG